jgi:NADPH:quinone reductase-like Zn-dependent oxidoreductase
VACTVHANVFLHAALTRGETLLVHGGSSGIGTMAIQLGHAIGARVICTAGRLVVIGMQGGTIGELNLGQLLRKRASVFASALRGRPAPEKAEIVSAVGDHIWPLIESGEVAPVIDRILPLDQAAEAHRVIDTSEHVGKVLLAT